MDTIYKIRIKGTNSYSRGRVSRYRVSGDYVYSVKWANLGKDWTSEAALKNHLLKCIEKGVDMTGWEIMEFTQQPSKSLNEWCDAKMTFAMLNRK